MGLSIVCLETDASMVKSAIEGDEYQLSALGGIITELKLVLLSEFRSWKTCFCPRVCNKAADTLAAYGSRESRGSQFVWDDVPHFLEALLISDSTESDE